MSVFGDWRGMDANAPANVRIVETGVRSGFGVENVPAVHQNGTG